MKVYVPDTSVVIEGVVRRMIEEGKITGKLMIPNAVIAELEHQAGSGREIGLVGLGEINKIRELCKENNIEFEFFGDRPSEFQVKKAKLGEIDALIRRLAVELKAILITNDLVQAESGKAYGIEVIYEEKEESTSPLMLEKFFDATSPQLLFCNPDAIKDSFWDIYFFLAIRAYPAAQPLSSGEYNA